jgi:hypothetical protein
MSSFVLLSGLRVAFFVSRKLGSAEAGDVELGDMSAIDGGGLSLARAVKKTVAEGENVACCVTSGSNVAASVGRTRGGDGLDEDVTTGPGTFVGDKLELTELGIDVGELGSAEVGSALVPPPVVGLAVVDVGLGVLDAAGDWLVFMGRTVGPIIGLLNAEGLLMGAGAARLLVVETDVTVLVDRSDADG